MSKNYCIFEYFFYIIYYKRDSLMRGTDMHQWILVYDAYMSTTLWYVGMLSATVQEPSIAILSYTTCIRRCH